MFSLVTINKIMRIKATEMIHNLFPGLIHIKMNCGYRNQKWRINNGKNGERLLLLVYDISLYILPYAVKRKGGGRAICTHNWALSIQVVCLSGLLLVLSWTNTSPRNILLGHSKVEEPSLTRQPPFLGSFQHSSHLRFVGKASDSGHYRR